MTSIILVIPGQPQGKGRPRVGQVGGHARMFTPAKTVAYEGLIAHAGQLAMQGRAPIEGPVAVVVDMRCQIPASWSKKKQAQALDGLVRPTTKPDQDNVLKAIFDGLNGVAWRDDVQVVDITSRKRYAATPGVCVEIKPLETHA
jgi:Holliday junction resolvase RusA-like endonuclease